MYAHKYIYAGEVLAKIRKITTTSTTAVYLYMYVSIVYNNITKFRCTIHSMKCKILRRLPVTFQLQYEVLAGERERKKERERERERQSGNRHTDRQTHRLL